jgi:hypothetical protein
MGTFQNAPAPTGTVNIEISQASTTYTVPADSYVILQASTTGLYGVGTLQFNGRTVLVISTANTTVTGITAGPGAVLSVPASGGSLVLTGVILTKGA